MKVVPEQIQCQAKCPQQFTEAMRHDREDLTISRLRLPDLPSSVKLSEIAKVAASTYSLSPHKDFATNDTTRNLFYVIKLSTPLTNATT